MKTQYGLIRFFVASTVASLIVAQFYASPDAVKTIAPLVGMLGFCFVLLYKNCYLADIVIVAIFLMMGFASAISPPPSVGYNNFDPHQARFDAALCTAIFGTIGAGLCLCVRYLCRARHDQAKFVLAMAIVFLFSPVATIVVLYGARQKTNRIGW